MSCANTSCPNCNGVCNTEQSLCTINSQNASTYGGEFSWPVNPEAETIIAKVWTAEAWNNLKSAIDKAYSAGSQCSSAGQSFGPNTMTTVNNEDVITAEIYNNAGKAINKLGGDVETVVSKETIIRHYHATSMAAGYNNGEIYGNACNDCNVSCDVQCNKCVGCVSCEGVQHYSTCYSSCHKPTPSTPPST